MPQMQPGFIRKIGLSQCSNPNIFNEIELYEAALTWYNNFFEAKERFSNLDNYIGLFEHSVTRFDEIIYFLMYFYHGRDKVSKYLRPWRKHCFYTSIKTALSRPSIQLLNHPQKQKFVFGFLIFVDWLILKNIYCQCIRKGHLKE